MVDVITNTMPKNVSSKLSVEEDYEQNKGSGNFIYDSNKKRSAEDKNVNVEMPQPRPRPQPPTVDDTVGDKSVNVPQPDDTEGDRSVVPPSTDDTEGVTKPILRGPSPSSTRNDLRKESRKEDGIAASKYGPQSALRGITSYSGKDAGLDTNQIREEAKKDLIDQRARVTQDDLEAAYLANNLPRELSQEEADNVKVAIAIRDAPDATQQEKINSQKTLDYTVSVINGIRNNTSSIKSPFSRGLEGTGVFNPTEKAEQLAGLGDFDLINQQKYYFESRKELYKVVKGVAKGASLKDQVLIEGILLDDISTGEFWDTTIEGLNEVNRGLLQLPNLVLHGGWSASKAVYNATIGPESATKSISQAWDDTKADREEANKQWANALDSIDSGSLASVINDSIYRGLKQKRDDGIITDEKFKELTQIRVDKTNTVNGQPVTTTEIQDVNFIDENEAQSFLSEAINQMTVAEQYGMIALETFFTVGSLAKGNVQSGLKKYTELSRKTKELQKRQIKLGNKRYLQPQSALKLYNKMRVDELIDEFDMEKINRAIRFKGSEDQMFGMNKELGRLKRELRGKEYKNLPKDSVMLIKKKKEISSLKGKIFRNYVFGNTTPVLKESLAIALPAAVTQLIFTQLLAGKDGSMDFYTAQGIGALVHIIGGLKLPFLKGLTTGDIALAGPRWVKNAVVPGIAETMASIVGIKRLEKINSSMPSIFKANDMAEYETIVFQKTGRKLSRKQRKGAEFIFRMTGYMDKEDVKKLMDNIDGQIELEDSVIKFFPVDEQEEMLNLIAAPFAQVSDLSFLKSAYAMTGEKLNAGDLGSWDKINQMQDLSNRADERVKFLGLAIDKIRQKMAGRTDIENPEAIEKFLAKYDNIVNEHEVEMLARDTGLNDDLIKINEIAFLDLDGTLDARTADNLLNASVVSRMKINKALSYGQALEEQVAANYKLLDKRADLIKLSRKDDNHFEIQNKFFEQVMESHIQSYYARAKKGYAPVDKMALDNNKMINLSDLILDYKEIAEDASPLKKFFGKDNVFWDSTINKKLRVSMQRMASRTLAELPEELVVKVKAMASNPDSSYYIKDYDGNDLDLVLLFQELGDIKSFNATPSEAMDLLAAFKDFAARQGSPDQQRMYNSQVGKLKAMVKEQYPEFGEALDIANENYKREVFDRVSGAGPLTDFLSSKQRTTEVGKVKGSNQYMNSYKKGKSPDVIFSSLIKDVEFYMKDPELDLGGKIKQSFKDIQFQMSDFFDGNPNPVFNLDDPDSLAKFTVLQKMFEERIYAKWGDKITNQLANVDTRIRGGGGYDFSPNNGKALDQLSDWSKVRIIQDGVERDAPLLNFKQMILDEKDIVKLVGENKKTLEQYNVFKTTTNAQIKNIIGTEQKVIRLRDQTLLRLQRLAGSKDSDAFYQNYVLNGTAASLRQLKNDALTKKVNIDGVVQPAMKEKEFDDAILYWLTNGMLSRGGRTVISGVNKFGFKKFDGTHGSPIGFTNPQVLMDDLNKPKIREIFEEVLGVDHTKFMYNLMDLVDREMDMAKNLQGISGIVRPITMNEVISRSFNLARGMVSPTYVAAELAVRLASGAGIEMMKLAAQDKEAARLMKRMIQFPEKLQKVELDKITLLFQDFLISEFAGKGMTVPDFVYELTDSLNPFTDDDDDDDEPI